MNKLSKNSADSPKSPGRPSDFSFRNALSKNSHSGRKSPKSPSKPFTLTSFNQKFESVANLAKENHKLRHSNTQSIEIKNHTARGIHHSAVEQQHQKSLSHNNQRKMSPSSHQLVGGQSPSRRGAAGMPVTMQ